MDIEVVRLAAARGLYVPLAIGPGLDRSAIRAVVDWSLENE